jgi:hypothetical protein
VSGPRRACRDRVRAMRTGRPRTHPNRADPPGPVGRSGDSAASGRAPRPGADGPRHRRPSGGASARGSSVGRLRARGAPGHHPVSGSTPDGCPCAGPRLPYFCPTFARPGRGRLAWLTSTFQRCPHGRAGVARGVVGALPLGGRCPFRVRGLRRGNASPPGGELPTITTARPGPGPDRGRVSPPSAAAPGSGSALLYEAGDSITRPPALPGPPAPRRSCPPHGGILEQSGFGVVGRSALSGAAASAAGGRWPNSPA